MDGSLSIKQEEDTDQSLQINYPKGMVTVSTADVHQINNMTDFYLPSKDTFEKANEDGHLNIENDPALNFPVTLDTIALRDSLVNESFMVQNDDKVTILALYEKWNERHERIRGLDVNNLAVGIETVMKEIQNDIHDWIDERTPFSAYMQSLEIAFYRRLLKYYNEATDAPLPILEQEFWYKFCMQGLNNLTSKCYVYFYSFQDPNTLQSMVSERPPATEVQKTVSFETGIRPSIIGGRILRKLRQDQVEMIQVLISETVKKLHAHDKVFGTQ